MVPKSLALFGLAIVVIAGMIMVSACTGTSTPTATPTATPSATPSVTPTPAPATMAAYNQSDNNKTVNAKGGDTFTITLEENPSTGYAWNATVTSGLNIVNSTFKATNTTLVGVPGLRVWEIQTTDVGAQKFSAIYMRSNETLVGNETTYVLNVNVSAPTLGMIWP